MKNIVLLSVNNLYKIAMFLLLTLLFCVHIFLMPQKILAIDLPTAISADGKNLETENSEPWKIFADELVSINDGVVLEGKGNVVLSRGDDYLRADFARLYTNTQWILLQGNVYAKLGSDEVRASEAEFDLQNKSGWVQDARIFMAGPHLYFSSKELYKDEGDVYHLKEAVVTACDGDSPLWSVSAVEAIVEADSYAHFQQPVFKVKNKGVIASPYLVVPTKTTRQTGFLLPEYGYSSEQGLYYTQPWFYAIDQSRDLTVYGTVITKKGVLGSLEYRSHPEEDQKLWASLDLMFDDDKVFSDHDDDVDASDGLIRDSNLRYWLRGMGNGDFLDTNWRYKYNLDYVSDQNFLREYQNRMTGFDNSRDVTFDLFGRDFTEVDQNRITEGYVYRDFERLTLAAGFRFEQDPSFGNGNASYSTDDTVQHLPEIYAFWNRGAIIPKFPMELNASFRTGYMYRQEGTTGFRTEIYPTLTLPIDLHYASMELTSGLRTTLYNNTSENRNAPSIGNQNRAKQTGESRIMPEFGVNLYTQTHRIYEFEDALPMIAENLGQSNYTGMRHSIQPRISYKWLDNVDQEDNPFYIVDDRLYDINDLEFSLDNRFTFRKNSIVRTEKGLEQQTSYHDLLRAQLYFGFDFRENGRKKHLEQFEKRPVHDLHLRLSSDLKDWLTLYTDTYYSFYEHNVSRSDTGFTLRHKKFGSFSTDYSWRDKTFYYRELSNYDNLANIIPTKELNVITNRLALNLSPKITISALERTNLADGSSYEREIGISYLHQCVRFVAEYSKDSIEERFQLSVEFLGLTF